MSRAKVLLVALMMPLLWVETAAARIEFAEGEPFLISRLPDFFAVGEFNRDGIADLAVSSFQGNQINVLLGSPTGRFLSSQVQTFGNVQLRDIAVADFNQDGLDDIAVIDRRGNRGRVWIMLGRGTGQFEVPFPVEVRTAANAARRLLDIVADDFDLDGDIDMAVVDEATGRLFILQNDGGNPPQFRIGADLIVGGRPQFLVKGDFDLDGDNDLAVIDKGPGIQKELIILRNDGADAISGFPLFVQVNKYGLERDPWALVAADFNNNGVIDLGMLNNPLGGGNAQVTTDVNIMHGRGNNNFVGPQIVNIRCPFQQGNLVCRARRDQDNFVTGDFDGDGFTDFAVPIGDPRDGSQNDFLSVYRGRPNGAFVAARDFLVAKRPDTIAVADFTGDGRDDIVIGSRLRSSIIIMINNSTPPESDGTPCVLDDDCISGFCEDGVCCEQRCGIGESCNIIGEEGRCTPLLGIGSDCDHCSQCRTRSCIDGVCCDQFCPEGLCCSGPCTRPGDRCDRPGFVGMCERPGRIGDPCDDPAHCPPGTFCTNGICCVFAECPPGLECVPPSGQCAVAPTPTPVPAEIGERCDADAECRPPLFCTDNVCCKVTQCPEGHFCAPRGFIPDNRVGECVAGTPRPTPIPTATATPRVPTVAVVVARGGGCSATPSDGAGGWGFLLVGLPLMLWARRRSVAASAGVRR